MAVAVVAGFYRGIPFFAYLFDSILMMKGLDRILSPNHWFWLSYHINVFCLFNHRSRNICLESLWSSFFTFCTLAFSGFQLRPAIAPLPSRDSAAIGRSRKIAVASLLTKPALIERLFHIILKR